MWIKNRMLQSNNKKLTLTDVKKKRAFSPPPSPRYKILTTHNFDDAVAFIINQNVITIHFNPMLIFTGFT